MQKLSSNSRQNPDLTNQPDPTESGPHSLLHSLDDSPMTNSSKPTKQKKAKTGYTLIIALVVIFSGTITGFGLHKVVGSTGSSGSIEDGVSGVEQGSGIITDGSIKVGETLGNPEKTGDSAEGVLVAGGINGEGSHRILRPGGPSQTVYLTSSVIDLSQIEGHKIKVWGETFSAQSAGWLMDVVTVEVLELDAPLPFQED